LREGDERFRILVESVRDYAIFMLDVQGRVQTWNAGAELVKGYKLEEILGRTNDVFYLPEDRKVGLPRALLAKAATDGRIEHEGWRVRKDGSRFWADVVITALRNDAGELVGFAKVTRDLTERRRLEDQRLTNARADERFRVIVNSIKDYAIFMLDPNGHVATWNAGAEAIKLYAPAEIIGKPIEVFYTPEDRKAGRPAMLLGRAAREGRIEDEGWRVRKDGSRFWADVVITALRDGSGRLIGYSKVTRDLTERRQTEEQLRRSEERFRLLVDSVEDYAIFMLDPKGHVATWNSGAERIKGWKAHEVMGRHFSLFRQPSEVREGRCEAELEAATRVGRIEEEGWRMRRDGSRFWANVVLSAVRSPTGRLLGFAKVTRDLTERRRLEDERLSRARAVEALRIRDEFLSIASHELKTPLTSLQIELYALREKIGENDERLSRRIERASRTADRLTNLVDTVLDVARIATGKLSLKLERFDISETVARTVDTMRMTAAKAGCELTFKGVGPIVGCWDRLRVEQVVMNLLANAFKYGAGQPVSVQLTLDRGDAVIDVRDHGPGIPPQDLKRIFERFERAVSIANYGGLGLGLYVSQEIAREQRGTIAARNLEDGGACFTVRLPIDPAVAAEPAADPEPTGGERAGVER
jgi:PAS domain S-box-containing protein